MDQESLTVEYLLENSAHSKSVVSVKPTDMVMDAAQLMRRHKIGLVIVVENEQIVGVLSERDIVQRWVCSEQFPTPVEVGSIMSKNVEITNTEESLFDCYKRFIKRSCRHLPVLDPLKRVVGVLSLRNVSDYVVNELKKQLK